MKDVEDNLEGKKQEEKQRLKRIADFDKIIGGLELQLSELPDMSNIAVSMLVIISTNYIDTSYLSIGKFTKAKKTLLLRYYQYCLFYFRSSERQLD